MPRRSRAAPTSARPSSTPSSCRSTTTPRRSLASGPAITEEVKYGGILFASRTGFCGVFVYTNHVTLEFGDGSTLPDPHGVLAGKGKLRRHIRIDSEHDLEAKKVGDYINAARARSDAV